MEAESFDEESFFAAISRAGVRALLIGRRALIALGLPVLTSDYDFWIHIDDIELFNRGLSSLGMFPSMAPEEARRRGRYVVENGQRADVLVARSCPTINGERISFDGLWERRREIELIPGVALALPTIRDLMATKRFGNRAKDAEDLRLLEDLLEEEQA
jgi:hypothetical protein